MHTTRALVIDSVVFFLSLSQRTRLAYDVWPPHSLPLRKGTQVRESGTPGTLCNDGRYSRGTSSQLHRELCEPEREKDTLTCLLTCENMASR